MTNHFPTRAPIVTLVAAFLISACEPVETATPTSSETTATTIETQNSAISDADLATAAELIAKAIDSGKNEDSAGIRLLGARSEGSTVIIENKLTRTRVYVEPSRARRQLRASVCEDSFIKSFINGGGEFQFVYLPRSNGSGQRESVTISSC